MASSAKRNERERNQHIQVYVRCRPANLMEKESASALLVEVNPENKEVLVREKMGMKEQQKRFTFDKVFAPNSTQVDVYKAVAGPMIDEVLMGYNCTVFAYGQTGTGKTYTMQGCKSGDLYTWDTDPQSGIIPRVFHHLFDVLGQQEVEYNVRVSYLELYNEELFDLLGSLTEATKLRLYEDSSKKGSVVIQGLSEIIVHNKDEVYHILEKGAERKRMAATLMNDTSSRSHTVFSITVHIKESTLEGEDLVKIGKLNLVDLAGSECIGRSGAVDKRAREAGNINQSLLTLGRVITALVEKAPHIPYRESKLTRLLQDSLGGRTKTSIIATISPAQMNLEETNSTLEYAHRAKNITNKPEINQKMTKRALIKEYTEEIERLRRDLMASREKNGIYVDSDNYNEMRSKLSNQSEAIKERLADIDALKEQKQKVTELFFQTKNELDERTNDLKMSEENLHRTERHLKEKDTILKITEYDREAQKHLVNVQAKTEKTLKGQAETLLQVATNTTKDLTGLFSKLDRKSLVETTNQRLVKDFRNSLHGQIENLEDCLCGMFNSYRQQITTLKNSLEINAEEVQRQSANQMHLMECLSNMNSKYKTSAERDMTGAEENCNKQLEATLTFKSIELEEIILPKFQVLGESNKTLQSAFQSFRQSQMQQIEELSTSLTCGFTSMLSSFKDIGRVLDQELSSMSHSFAQRDQRVKDRSHRQKHSIQVMMNALAEYERVREEEEEKEEESLGEIISNVTSSLGVLKTKCETTYEASIADFHTSTAQKLSKTLEDLSSNATCVEETVTKSGEEIESLERNIQDAHQQEKGMINSCRQALQLDVQKIATDLMEHENSSSEILKASCQTLSESREYREGLEKEVLDHVEELSQWSQEGRGLLSSRLESVQQSASDLVDKELKIDHPTGLTPQRKDYTFPRYLAYTLPHQKILDQFRRNMDDTAALSVCIPESPSKEEQEPLPPLLLEVPDSENENLSDVSETSSTGSNNGRKQASSETKENKSKKRFSKAHQKKLLPTNKTNSGPVRNLLKSPN